MSYSDISLVIGKLIMVDKKILSILACPQCKGEVIYVEKEEIFVCLECRLQYSVEDGIPNFLIDEAKRLEIDELRRYLSYKS